MIIIPLGNLVLGLYSILFALKGEIEYAVLLLWVGLLLDGLDGYIARKLDRKSDVNYPPLRFYRI
ncbi:CDP-alcohol phosphatidyltransferase family protein, partial [Aneurinibacillus aneurinilyticus]